jgi:hypothetical protein
MGIDKGFETQDFFKKPPGRKNGDVLFTPTEVKQVGDFTARIDSGEPLTESETRQAAVLFSKGMGQPEAQPDVIAALMNPAGAGLLKEVFENTWTPRLGFGLKAKLELISREPREENRIIQLSRTVVDYLIGEPDASVSTPGNSRTPGSSGPEEEIPLQGANGFALLFPLYGSTPQSRGKEQSSEQATPIERTMDPVDDLVNAHKADDWGTVEEILENSPNPRQLLEDGGEQTWALLIDIAGKPPSAETSQYSGMAVELLSEQGSDIISVLEEASTVNPLAKTVIYKIKTGEWPGHSMKLDRQLSQIAGEGNTDLLEQLIGTSGDLDKVCDQIVYKGKKMVPVLIKMLGKSGSARNIAMDSLYRMGSQSVEPLRMAKASPDLQVAESAKTLLHHILTGERSDSGLSHQAPNPYARSPFESTCQPGDPGIGQGSTLIFDTEDVKEKLLNPGTHIETLSSLKQIGKPAVHTLCRILLQHPPKGRQPRR